MTDCVAALTRDLALVRAVLADHGMVLDGTGLDNVRAPLLVTEHPRYVALAEYHERSGPKGLEVMCNSASIQVCLDAGSDEEEDWGGYKRRWWLADAIGPVVMAAFANSPHAPSPAGAGRRTGRACASAPTPAAPGRRAATTTRAPPGPGTRWPRKVAMVAGPGRWHVPAGLTMRAWLRGHGPARSPWRTSNGTSAPSCPPVRPRGYLELRMIDQQPGDGWVVPVAVVTALLDDPQGAEAGAAATEPLRSPLRRHRDWVGAAREGLADPRWPPRRWPASPPRVKSCDGRVPRSRSATRSRSSPTGMCPRPCPAEDAASSAGRSASAPADEPRSVARTVWYQRA